VLLPDHSGVYRVIAYARGRRSAGVLLSFVVAGAALGCAQLVPLGSAPVIGIVLGVCIGAVVNVNKPARDGVRWCASVPLKAAVVALGAELPLSAVIHQGFRSLPGIVITVLGCVLAAQLLGRRLSVVPRLRSLIGAGTAICGASAIAAVTPVIDAEETEVGYAVATIFLFNILAVALFPLLGHLLGLGQHAFGVFAGTAVNDLSSVVATGGVYGSAALHTAVVVKLTRTLMIVPLSVALARTGRSVPERPTAGARAKVSIPRFLIGFLLLAGLRGIGIVPAAWSGALSSTATILITVALSAVGLSVDLSGLRRAGVRPIVLGAALWITVSALSLGCQAAGLM
jgi:uncharacterized integral membrane protein (TIGR00698 family)